MKRQANLIPIHIVILLSSSSSTWEHIPVNHKDLTFLSRVNNVLI